MANLSEETLNKIFNIQKQLFKIINEATATDYNLVEQYGETATTLTELEELSNIKERARDAYTRLFRLLLNIGETQPIINQSTLELLYRSIEQADLTVNALEISIQEIKNNWDLK
jgi:dimeric dUTPase (all-alpha-NTP-PPase superfamily)